MINLKFKLIYIIIINSIAFILSIIALYDTHRVKKKFEKILKNKEEQQKTRREGTIRKLF